MHTAQLRRLALGTSTVVAVLCIVSVLVAVVRTGRDGRITDYLAVVAVAALVLSWRLYRQLQQHAVAD